MATVTSLQNARVSIYLLTHTISKRIRNFDDLGCELVYASPKQEPARLASFHACSHMFELFDGNLPSLQRTEKAAPSTNKY